MMLRWTCFAIFPVVLSGCGGDGQLNDSNLSELELDRSQLEFSSTDESQEFGLSNIGKDTLNWSITDEQSWLSVSPVSGGAEEGASERINVTVDHTGLARGEYTGTINISSNGGDDSVSVTIQVPNHAPEITSAAPVASIVMGQVFQYDVAGVDANQDSLTYSLCGTPPAGAAIGSESGTVLWTANGSGDIPLCIQVSDEDGASDQQNFTLTVLASTQPFNQKPKITSTAPVTSIVIGQVFQYDVEGVDADQDALAYSLCGMPPAGATIDSESGLISWTTNAFGNTSWCVQVSDGKGGNDQQNFMLTVIDAGSSSIDISEENLNFGSAMTSKSFIITNTGEETVDWKLTRNEKWIRATPPTGSVKAGESKTVTVTVDRSALNSGTYNGEVNVAYSNKNKVVSVVVEMGGSRDTEAPNNTTNENFINSGATSTSSSSVILSLSATDNIAVTGVFIKDQKCSVSAPDKPSQSSVGWVGFTTSQSYEFKDSYVSGDQVCTYVWFRDAAGNVSGVQSDNIDLLISGDSVAPYDVSLTINGGETSTTSKSVTLNLSAKDGVGVVGYYVSENSVLNTDNWKTVASTTSYSQGVPFTLSNGDGSKTVYGWFKDEAGNLSTIVNGTIAYTEPASGGGTIFDVDLTTGNLEGGMQTGGDLSNVGWRVTGNNQRIVFDAGRKIKNGYIETTFTTNQNPWIANPTGNDSKNNFVGVYESGSLNHSRVGGVIYIRQGNAKYDFGRWKAGYGPLADRLNENKGFMETDVGNPSDWNTDDSTIHTIKMTWENGNVSYSGTGEGRREVLHDVLREGGYRIENLQYGFIGLDKSYNDNRGVPGLLFKSFKMVDLGN